MCWCRLGLRLRSLWHCRLSWEYHGKHATVVSRAPINLCHVSAEIGCLRNGCVKNPIKWLLRRESLFGFEIIIQSIEFALFHRPIKLLYLSFLCYETFWNTFIMFFLIKFSFYAIWGVTPNAEKWTSQRFLSNLLQRWNLEVYSLLIK